MNDATGSPLLLDKSKAFTVEMWANFVTGETVRVGRRGKSYTAKDDAGWSLTLKPSQIRAQVYGKYWHDTNFTTNLKGWHHVAWSFNNGKSTLWIDGANGSAVFCVIGLSIKKGVNGVCDFSSEGNPTPTVGKFGVGVDADKTGKVIGYFKGQLDELRVSKTARFANAFKPVRFYKADSNTIALWHFDEGQGTVAGDSSSSPNMGKVNGNTQWLKDNGYGGIYCK